MARARATLLVHPGHCSHMSLAEWLVNNRHVLLTVLGAAKSKLRAPAWPPSGKSPSLLRNVCPLQCIHTVGGTGELSGASSIRTLSSFLWAPPS